MNCSSIPSTQLPFTTTFCRIASANLEENRLGLTDVSSLWKGLSHSLNMEAPNALNPHSLGE